MVGLTGSK
jgi:hypothetical protein